MDSSKCCCVQNQDKAEEKINKLSHRLQLAIINSPQFSFEILCWLKNVLDNFSKYETMLMGWENHGCLDLQCTSCKFTKNKKNNRRKQYQRVSDSENSCLGDTEWSSSDSD